MTVSELYVLLYMFIRVHTSPIIIHSCHSVSIPSYVYKSPWPPVYIVSQFPNLNYNSWQSVSEWTGYPTML